MNKQGQRTAREHFRLLYTLLHALAQSGAKVVDTGSMQPVDPHAAVASPEDGPGVEYLVQLSPGDADLITQVYILQAMIVADARVAVRWSDHEGHHEDTIVKIGWSDSAQLTSTPFSVMPADYRGVLRLHPASCEFQIRI